MLSSEVDCGMERWRKTQEEKKKKEGKNLSLLLKSKGDRLLKKYRGMERWRKTQEEKKKKEGKNLSLLLKSKGDRLLKK
ncbi:UNVERIFIED_CONTAM: hypothetical protein FKN15_078202 [Acipenser sinensis]